MTYVFLLAVQLCEAILFIWQELPDFNQVLNNPGVQLPKDAYSDLLMVGVFCAMQTAFWIRMVRIPIPFRSVNLFLCHIFLFLGRLSFIFGSSFFAVVVFRHLPELGPGIRIPLATLRGMLLVACLFALFCTSLELERLGHALESNGSKL
jgi:hypothetical protein